MSRRTRIAAGLLVFIVCAVVSYLVTLAVMAEPGAVQDRTGEMNAILDSALPQGADATPLLLEAETIARGLRDGKALSIDSLRQGEWGDRRLEGERALWSSYADEVIPLIRRAARCDVIRNPFVLIEGRINTTLNANRGSYWIMHNVVLVGLRESYENADWQNHFEWLDTGSNHIRMLVVRPYVMDGIVTRAMWSSFLYELRTQAIEGRLPESVCYRLIEHIQQIDLHPHNFATVGAMYRQEVHTSFDRWFAPSGLAVLPVLENLPFSEPWHENPPQALYSGLENLRALFVLRRLDAERELDDRIAEAVASMQGDDQAPQPVWGGRSGSVAIPGINALRSVAQQWGRWETERTGTILMLRLAAHYSAHGRWPETLADVATEEETIDPLTGAPFEYELTPDDPDGAPFRLATAPPPGSGWGKWHFSHTRDSLGIPHVNE